MHFTTKYFVYSILKNPLCVFAYLREIKITRKDAKPKISIN